MCDACCCGDERFADTRAPIEDLHRSLLDSLAAAGMDRQCPVALTECMGPCAIGNNVILATQKQNFLFRKMNQPEDLKALVNFAMSLARDSKAELPPELKNKLEAREII